MNNYTYNGSLLKTKKPKKKQKAVTEKLFNFDHTPILLEPWQVAEILGVTVKTVANYRLLGYFPAYYVSKRKYLYRTTDIERFIQKRYKENPF